MTQRTPIVWGKFTSSQIKEFLQQHAGGKYRFLILRSIPEEDYLAKYTDNLILMRFLGIDKKQLLKFQVEAGLPRYIHMAYLVNDESLMWAARFEGAQIHELGSQAWQS